MKWIISTIITIILVPKLQPIVGDYIESEFINNVGLSYISLNNAIIIELAITIYENDEKHGKLR